MIFISTGLSRNLFQTFSTQMVTPFFLATLASFLSCWTERFHTTSYGIFLKSGLKKTSTAPGTTRMCFSFSIFAALM